VAAAAPQLPARQKKQQAGHHLSWGEVNTTAAADYNAATPGGSEATLSERVRAVLTTAARSEEIDDDMDDDVLSYVRTATDSNSCDDFVADYR